MRPMVMDFSADPAAVSQAYQYMFGKSILVAPITEPGVTQWKVYLPKNIKWYDFWSGNSYAGGQTINAAAPQDRIPLFVRAGSIIPVGGSIQYSSQKTDEPTEIRIYQGADGNFKLYNDEGDNYNYEKGKFKTIGFHWNEKSQQLTIDKAQGSYVGASPKQVFNIVWVGKGNGQGLSTAVKGKKITYTGDAVTVKR